MARDVHAGLGIDARDFKLLAKALRTAQVEMYAELHEELRAVGQVVADEARALVQPYSQSIPPTIKVRAAGARVSVTAGGGRGGKKLAAEIFSSSYGSGSHLKALENEAEGPAIAGLLELGNKGGGSKSAAATRRGEFRHPVFGNRNNWVIQPMHPYLAPALRNKWPVVLERVTATLDKAAHTIAYDYLGDI